MCQHSFWHNGKQACYWNKLKKKKDNPTSLCESVGKMESLENPEILDNSSCSSHQTHISELDLIFFTSTHSSKPSPSVLILDRQLLKVFCGKLFSQATNYMYM